MTNQIVVKSNRLAESSYNLELKEQRFLAAAFSKVDSRNPKRGDWIRVDLDLYRESFPEGSRDEVKWRDMVMAVERLKNRDIRLNWETPEGEKHRYVASWVTEYLRRGERDISVRIAEAVMNELTALTGYFIQYEVSEMRYFNSKYAPRIYEWIKTVQTAYRVKKQKPPYILKMSPAEMQERLDLPQSYSDYGSLRKRVIEKAVTDINEHTKFNVKVSRKSGRSNRTLAIVFRVTEKANV